MSSRFTLIQHRVPPSWQSRASRRAEELAFKPVASRLAGLLLDYYQDATSEPVPRSLTLDQMAAHIGTTWEMVYRLLFRFSDRNVLAAYQFPMKRFSV